MTLPTSKSQEQVKEAQAYMMGNLSDEQVYGNKALSMAQQTKQASSERKKQKQQSDYTLLLQTLYQDIENMNRDIASMEAGFEAEFGDAWREEIALRVLSPNDFPQRRDGESMADYRERMEDKLVEEMLNPDGSIKEKYKNNPELAKYAEWAHTVYNRDKAVERANTLEKYPAKSPEAQAVLNDIEQERNSEQNNFIARGLSGSEEQKQAVMNIDDNNSDATTQVARSNNVALNFLQ